MEAERKKQIWRIAFGVFAAAVIGGISISVGLSLFGIEAPAKLLFDISCITSVGLLGLGIYGVKRMAGA